MSLSKRIDRLKEEKNAVILAHNYQIQEVQEVADFLGDSLGLSIEASETDADVIVFCGVDFMAESAKILSPEKTVLLPEPGAKCPMAAMCDPGSIAQMREQYPEAAVVGYVNTSAESKAEMDCCCTSANAVKVVKAMEEDRIIFVPDNNLGRYVKRSVKEKEVILFPGFCPTHQSFTPGQIARLKEEHPEAEVIVHPESRPEVIDHADFVGSTSGLIKRVHESDAEEFIIGTEMGIISRLKRECPDKTYYELPSAVCPPMKMIDLESVVNSLEHMETVIDLDPETIKRARIPLERMTKIGR